MAALILDWIKIAEYFFWLDPAPPGVAVLLWRYGSFHAAPVWISVVWKLYDFTGRECTLIWELAWCLREEEKQNDPALQKDTR